MGSFSDAEIRAEQRMAEEGLKSYQKKIRKAKEHKRESTTPAGRHLLRETVEVVAQALKLWRQSVDEKETGRGHAAAPFVDLLKPKVLALITSRVVIDAISHTRSSSRVAFEIARSVELEYEMQRVKADHRHEYRLVDRLKQPRQFKEKAFRKTALRTGVRAKGGWARKDKARLGAVLLELFIQSTGLVHEKTIYPGGGRAKRILEATEETAAWITESVESHSMLFPWYMPTVDPPADWESLRGGGYHTSIVTRRPLVKFTDNFQEKALATRELSQVYSAVNLLQQTAWEIHPEILEVARYFWEERIPVEGLSCFDPTPVPESPGKGDEIEFKKWKRTAARVRLHNQKSLIKRIAIARTLGVAEEYQGRPFYYPHQLDFRGRAYPQTTFMHPQGRDIERALLRFHEGAPIGNRGGYWLAVHGANCYGEDKVSFDDRVAWVEKHWEQIELAADDPISNRDSWEGADKPWQFLAFCLEWAPYVRGGRDPDFRSSLSVAMDGSNNGLQIFSLLMRDPVGGRATNLLPSEVPQDIYQDVADKVTLKLEESSDARAELWLGFCEGRLPRKATKRSVMTLPYGLTQYSSNRYIQEWYEEEIHKQRLERGDMEYCLFGYDLFEAVRWLGEHVWAAIGETVGEARSCMDWMRELAELSCKAGVPVCWELPTGFYVRQAYTKYTSNMVSTLIGDQVRSVSYRKDTNRFSQRAQKNGIAPNYVHSLDAAAMMMTCNRMAALGCKQFAMVHDSYGVPAAHVDTIHRVLREAYADLFSEDLLEKFREEVQHRVGARANIPPVPERGDMNPRVLIESPYFFA